MSCEQNVQMHTLSSHSDAFKHLCSSNHLTYLSLIMVKSAHLCNLGISRVFQLFHVCVFSVRFWPLWGPRFGQNVAPRTSFRTPKYRPNPANGGPIGGKKPCLVLSVFPLRTHRGRIVDAGWPHRVLLVFFADA